MRFLSYSLMLLAFLFLGACASHVYLKPNPLAPILEKKINLKLNFRSYLGYAPNLKELLVCPVPLEDKVYSVSYDGRFYAVSLPDGKRLWRIDLGEHITAGPTIEENIAYVGSNKGTVFAIHLDTKKVQKVKLSHAIYVAPLVAQNLIVVQTDNDSVFALDRDTLETRWRFDTAGAPFSYLGGMKPIFYSGLIFLGLSDGRVLALHPEDGTLAWQARPGEILAEGLSSNKTSTLNTLLDADGAMIFEGNSIYMSAAMGYTERYDLKQDPLHPAWKSSKSSPNRLLNYEDSLILLSQDSSLHALSKKDGHELWSYDKMNYRTLSSPALLSDEQGKLWLLVGDYKGYVHIFDPDDGRIYGRFRPTISPILNCTITKEHSIYLLDAQGYLHSLSLTLPKKKD